MKNENNLACAQEMVIAECCLSTGCPPLWSTCPNSIFISKAVPQLDVVRIRLEEIFASRDWPCCLFWRWLFRHDDPWLSFSLKFGSSSSWVALSCLLIAKVLGDLYNIRPLRFVVIGMFGLKRFSEFWNLERLKRLGDGFDTAVLAGVGLSQSRGSTVR
jgi:hypothetical protein